jgi:hypothetical protein
MPSLRPRATPPRAVKYSGALFSRLGSHVLGEAASAASSFGEGFDRTDHRVPYTSHCTFSSPHAGSGGFQL